MACYLGATFNGLWATLGYSGLLFQAILLSRMLVNAIVVVTSTLSIQKLLLVLMGCRCWLVHDTLRSRLADLLAFHRGIVLA